MGERRWRVLGAVLAVLGGGSGACSKHGGDSTPGASRPPPSPPAGSLRAGPARIPAEVAACRAEESRRAAGEARELVPPPERPVALRHEPGRLTLAECDEMVRRWNFYSGNNPEGCFVNAFRWDGQELVTDLATGLLWQTLTSERPLGFSEVAPYLARLNREHRGGFSDWRLPTLEEGFSLMESVPFDNTHTDKLLFVTQKEWWTSDTHPEPGHQWVLFTVGGSCLLTPLAQNTQHYVRAVRTLP